VSVHDDEALTALFYTASPNVQCDYDWVRLASVSSLADCTAELAHRPVQS
jgi:hypothetical protein